MPPDASIKASVQRLFSSVTPGGSCRASSNLAVEQVARGCPRIRAVFFQQMRSCRSSQRWPSTRVMSDVDMPAPTPAVPS